MLNLPEVQDIQKKQIIGVKQVISKSKEKIETIPVSQLFRNGTENLLTINASSGYIESEEMQSFGVNKYQSERKKLESNLEVEDEFNINSAIKAPRTAISSLQSIDTISEHKLVNHINSDDSLTPERKPKNLDYSNELRNLDSAPDGITESLNIYRVISKSSGIPTFLSILTGICFLVYVVYLYRCRKSHNRHHINDCIEKEKYIDVAHLQMENPKIETIHSDILDALW